MFSLLLSLLLTPAAHYVAIHLYGADKPVQRAQIQADITNAVTAVVANHQASATTTTQA